MKYKIIAWQQIHQLTSPWLTKHSNSIKTISIATRVDPSANSTWREKKKIDIYLSLIISLTLSLRNYFNIFYRIWIKAHSSPIHPSIKENQYSIKMIILPSPNYLIMYQRAHLIFNSTIETSLQIIIILTPILRLSTPTTWT